MLAPNSIFPRFKLVSLVTDIVVGNTQEVQIIIEWVWVDRWSLIQDPRLWTSIDYGSPITGYCLLSPITYNYSGLLSISLFSSEKRIFCFCLAFRTLNALLLQTCFNSDEHWQGPEVAHRIAFGRKWGLLLAALAFAVRPTSAITWLYVGLLKLLTVHDRLRFLFPEMAPIGALLLGLTCLLDRFMYGKWILVPLNFLKFNFLSSGDYYGTHKWHWYFIQGFTVMIFTHLPFSLAGIIYSKQRKFSGLITWVSLFYSVLGHKEFRFVLPVLAIALMFSGYSLAIMNASGKKDP
ncbi:mannosyltransferase APTG1-like [Prosopis cineraria]|uniref:mannosyltransferase APTG1-like n=1 Tax=Prosopis cineraria TaxID=364024 RepID=UPI00240EB63D|nr:mannosyltransferase APTG1-like [Prosopis cineraria]